MALWPFGKKNKNAPAQPDTDSAKGLTGEAADVVKNEAELRTEDSQRSDADTMVVGEPAVESATESKDDSDDSGVAEAGHEAEAVIPHDAVGGNTGPFDGDNVDINDFDFTDFAVSVLNLGSIQIPLPQDSQVQVEMAEEGPRMLHVITRHGRVTPVAFASPNSGGLWESASEEIAEGMRNDGMPAVFELGPWGREIVGQGDGGVIRIIGVEGPRWMYRVTLAAPDAEAENMARLGREMVARSFVYRGNTPVLAGEALPVQLPAELAAQLQQAMAEAQAQQEHAGQDGPQGAAEDGETN
ncbi:DUF3710 domain-containing protein [Corynebacterium aquatimens]|uniref:DUF3710 domain-containing protein n=1 Tax=Corynebacterium aquatimens TaxID=1190508 RepID=A0A931DZX3_9CORY|nr:DUF3710 domain-containing protein [Corynebacterium aquatimens]MBG6121748.1 hypothetical protein [Corynebacterium aquatimens]WJY65713.1 hypothetical protein CAQUA_05000 [Corynebacterium aquatimens]